jgi:hypothetical protein
MNSQEDNMATTKGEGVIETLLTFFVEREFNACNVFTSYNVDIWNQNGWC